MKENIILVTDLDGTFVFDSTEVALDDLAQFNKVSKKCYTAVATGRSIKEIEYIEQKNGLKLDYKIGFNGAMIMDGAGEIVHNQPIPKEKVKRLLSFIKQNNLIFDALDGNERIGNFQHENPRSLWNMKLICMNNPFEQLTGRVIYKINIRPKKEVAKEIYTKLKRAFPELSIYQTGKKRIEVTDFGISKGEALKKCRFMKNMKVITVGDSENDIDMFRNSDISYCLDHAEDHVKQNAMYIINRFKDIRV